MLLSIKGMYDFDNTVLDNLIVPEGIDLNDVKDTQKYLDSMTEDKRVRLSYKGLPPYFQFGIKTICEICLKHPEDYSKLDIKLLKDILEEVS